MVVKVAPEIFCFAKKVRKKKSEVKACYKITETNFMGLTLAQIGTF